MSRRVWLLTRSWPSNSTLPRTRSKRSRQESVVCATGSALAAFSFSRNDIIIPLIGLAVAEQKTRQSVVLRSSASRCHLLGLGRLPAERRSQPGKRARRKSPQQLFIVFDEVGGVLPCHYATGVVVERGML